MRYEDRRKDYFEGRRGQCLRQASFKGPGSRPSKLLRIAHREEEAQFYADAIEALDRVKALEEENRQLRDRLMHLYESEADEDETD